MKRIAFVSYDINHSEIEVFTLAVLEMSSMNATSIIILSSAVHRIARVYKPGNGCDTSKF